jgi:hypothetical protein
MEGNLRRDAEPNTPYEITLESRNQVDIERRQMHDWDQSNRFSSFEPRAEYSGQLKDLKRDLTGEGLREALEIKRRATEDGAFITNLQFLTE